MSLLMEALKKAEAAKRQASEGNVPGEPVTPPSGLALKPLAPLTDQHRSPATTPPGSPLPELSQHIDSVDADLAAVSMEAPTRRRAPASAARPADNNPRETAERNAVRNVFNVKQVPKSHAGLWIVLGLAGLAALAFGGYFWWQMQAVSGSSLARTVQPMPPSAQPLPANQRMTSVAPTLPPVQMPAPRPEMQPPATALPIKAAPEPAPAIARSTVLRRSAERSPSAPDNQLRLSKTQPKSIQVIERAYDALQAGRLEEAQLAYEQVLRNDTKNTDALLGLATIAATQGQAERAHAYYLLALEADPNDATARAGVINTRGQADPVQSESRLKTALAGQPDSSALNFALGNLYARQSRWSEAQQAYFKAYSSEPGNADFIFNLAVSLDHLRQNRLAAQYYQLALSAAGAGNFLFDKNQAKTRVLELQP